MGRRDVIPEDPNYECDCEFWKLLTRSGDVDLTAAALELARDAYPDVDFRATLRWIDECAHELSPAVVRTRSDHEALRCLTEHLALERGLHGDSSCFDLADSSFLHRVIETRRGLPISLSLLYMAVGLRVGIDLHGVSTPMHFLTRYEAADGAYFIDAFSQGRVFNREECTRWLQERTRYSRTRIEATLKPVGPRAVITRMLNNLKELYVRHEDWPAAWLVQHRLTALNPASYTERRDLALISLRAQRPGHAVDLLESCIRACPAKEKDVLINELDRARNHLARWN